MTVSASIALAGSLERRLLGEARRFRAGSMDAPERDGIAYTARQDQDLGQARRLVARNRPAKDLDGLPRRPSLTSGAARGLATHHWPAPGKAPILESPLPR
ncbi:MAG TPA: hypothetical protein VMU95_32680 [Trebonia sp.]|nr:hypothetical protein [Trebonia sp.]